MVRGFRGQHLPAPQALLPNVFLAQAAGVMAADRAFRFGAGVYMDEDVGPVAKMGREDFLQFLDLPMAFRQGKIPGQNQVEIEQKAISGPPGPKAVDINPHPFAMFGQMLAESCQKFGVRGVHQPGKSLADQFGAGEQDIDPHQDGHRAVEPVPAGKHHGPQSQ